MPFWLLALLYFFFLSFVLSIWAALGNLSALVVLIALTLLLLLIAFRSRLIIQISDNTLEVGRANIDLKYVSHAIALTSKQMRLLRTRDADPGAYMNIRFWSSTGVQIFLDDKRDETPYWLVTSNKADLLIDELKKR